MPTRLVRAAIGVALLLGLTVLDAGAIIKDPGSPPDAMLDALADTLDAHGIDVRRRWSDMSDPDPERPQLARLSGYPAGSRPFIRASWMEDFERNVAAHDALLAVRGPETGGSAEDVGAAALEKLWNAAPLSDRIFISFTEADVDSALKIRDALVAQGYKVFVYRSAKGDPPTTPPSVVGRLFRSAGHHLVLDTPSARASIGVQLEAHSLAAIEASEKERAAEAEAKRTIEEYRTRLRARIEEIGKADEFHALVDDVVDATIRKLYPEYARRIEKRLPADPFNRKLEHRPSQSLVMLQVLGPSDYEQFVSTIADTISDLETMRANESGLPVGFFPEESRVLLEEMQLRRGVVVYGREGCSRTAEIREYLDGEGIEYIYRDFDDNYETASRLLFGDKQLPAVSVKGRAVDLSGTGSQNVRRLNEALASLSD